MSFSRPHQSRRVRIIVRIHVDAHLQQLRQVAAFEYRTAYMNGVDPSGPRAFSNAGLAVAAFMKAATLPLCNSSTIATASGFAGRQLYFVRKRVRPLRALIDPVLERGHLFGTRSPVGGICAPNSVPVTR